MNDYDPGSEPDPGIIELDDEFRVPRVATTLAYLLLIVAVAAIASLVALGVFLLWRAAL